MALGFLLLLLLCIPLYFALLFFLNPSSGRKGIRTPPSPPPIPILGNLLWLSKLFSHLGHVLRRLKAANGPIVTVYKGRHPVFFIMDRTLAHHSFVRNGVPFAHRPPHLSTSRALSRNLHTINMAAYGPHRRLLRRALSSNVFHPSHLGLQADARAWAPNTRVDELTSQAEAGGGIVKPTKSFLFSSFRLFTLLCFGDKLDQEMIRSIMDVQMGIMKLLVLHNIYNLLPKIVLVLFWRRWKKLVHLQQRLADVIVRLVRVRRQQRQSQRDPTVKSSSYLDTLLEFQHVDQGGRPLSEEELVSLCWEFLTASTDTTSTAVEWIMANLVKHQAIQEKLSTEIESVIGATQKATVEEEDIRRIPHLKAVVLEGLRRHPPVHYLLPHMVMEETALDGYVIPGGAIVNCSVAEIGRDGEVWTEPWEFRPERFLAGGEGEGVDLTGSREIKMMPFGAGRRMCPGMDISVLLVQYFVANLVSKFRWEGVVGEEVDLSEKAGLAVGMKNPLRACIVARKR